jgi:hypothetical protein
VTAAAIATAGGGGIACFARRARRSARVTRRPRHEREHVQVADNFAQLAPDHDTPVRDSICTGHEAFGTCASETACRALQVWHDGAVIRRRRCRVTGAAAQRTGSISEELVCLERGKVGKRGGRSGCLSCGGRGGGEAVRFGLDVPALVLMEEVAPEERVEGQRAPLARDGASREDRTKVEVGEDVERDLKGEGSEKVWVMSDRKSAQEAKLCASIRERTGESPGRTDFAFPSVDEARLVVDHAVRVSVSVPDDCRAVAILLLSALPRHAWQAEGRFPAVGARPAAGTSSFLTECGSTRSVVPLLHRLGNGRATQRERELRCGIVLFEDGRARRRVSADGHADEMMMIFDGSCAIRVVAVAVPPEERGRVRGRRSDLERRRDARRRQAIPEAREGARRRRRSEVSERVRARGGGGGGVRVKVAAGRIELVVVDQPG